jgi:hypothetical protein
MILPQDNLRFVEHKLQQFLKWQRAPTEKNRAGFLSGPAVEPGQEVRGKMSLKLWYLRGKFIIWDWKILEEEYEEIIDIISHPEKYSKQGITPEKYYSKRDVQEGENSDP